MLQTIAMRVAVGLIAVIALVAAYLALLSIFSKRPGNLGLVAGQLRPCPASPNCVCTHATDEEHGISPLKYSGAAADALARLKRVIEGLPRTRIVLVDGGYMHVEFTTMLFRFVDDVEFAVDEPTKTIHFRSASRVGHSDLGVNRRRMETIRATFDERSETSGRRD